MSYYKDPYDFPPNQRPYIMGYNAGRNEDDNNIMPNVFKGTHLDAQWQAGFTDGLGDKESHAEQYYGVGTVHDLFDTQP